MAFFSASNARDKTAKLGSDSARPICFQYGGSCCAGGSNASQMRPKWHHPNWGDKLRPPNGFAKFTFVDRFKNERERDP